MEDFTGTTSADKLSVKDGNDALSGGEGNDQIDGGDGDDLIGGGLGSDSIKGAAGNDTIYSAIDLNVALRTKADEQWDLPVGATLKTQGSNWGIAITTDQLSTVNTYLQTGATDNAPDFIDAGGGDDTVIAGRGNDMVQGGLGDDVLWGGGGNDVVDGGDGRDIIHGEGLLRFFNTPGYVAPAEYGDDFLDGGAGDDQVEGQGGNDSVYGGGGNDALFGDALYGDLAGQYHGRDNSDPGVSITKRVGHHVYHVCKAARKARHYKNNSCLRIFDEGYRPILHARLGARRANCLHGAGVVPNDLHGPRRHSQATF